MRILRASCRSTSKRAWRCGTGVVGAARRGVPCRSPGRSPPIRSRPVLDGLFSRFSAKAAQAKEPGPDRFVPYRRHVGRGAVECEGGILLAMVRLDGLGMEVDGPAEIEARAVTLNERYKALS